MVSMLTGILSTLHVSPLCNVQVSLVIRALTLNTFGVREIVRRHSAESRRHGLKAAVEM